MKSALIERTDGRSWLRNVGRSSGNISTKREGHDEIGSRCRTDPERARSNGGSGAGTLRFDEPVIERVVR